MHYKFSPGILSFILTRYFGIPTLYRLLTLIFHILINAPSVHATRHLFLESMLVILNNSLFFSEVPEIHYDTSCDN